MTSDHIERVIDNVFPRRTIRSTTAQQGRPDNDTVRVSFADGDVVYLKTSINSSRRIVCESAVLEYGDDRCPIETPSVVTAEPEDTHPYIVTEPLSGISLAKQWEDSDFEKDELQRQVGRILALVHGVQFSRPGQIVGGDQRGLDLKTGDWELTLKRVIHRRSEEMFADRFDDMPSRLIDVIEEKRHILSDPPVSLLHGDLSKPNFRLEPHGLLDWEWAFVGDPSLDLVDASRHLIDRRHTDTEEHHRLAAPLYEGYREQAGCLPSGFEDRFPIYRAITFLLIPQTFEVWAPTFDRPNDEIAADIREKFTDRLEQARAADP